MIAQRATGYNNIDLTAAEELGLTVARVSYYSPYSVAEFAWALALAVDRRIVRAAHRTREFDFRLDGPRPPEPLLLDCIAAIQRAARTCTTLPAAVANPPGGEPGEWNPVIRDHWPWPPVPRTGKDSHGNRRGHHKE